MTLLHIHLYSRRLERLIKNEHKKFTIASVGSKSYASFRDIQVNFYMVKSWKTARESEVEATYGGMTWPCALMKKIRDETSSEETCMAL